MKTKHETHQTFKNAVSKQRWPAHFQSAGETTGTISDIFKEHCEEKKNTLGRFINLLVPPFFPLSLESALYSVSGRGVQRPMNIVLSIAKKFGLGRVKLSVTKAGPPRLNKEKLFN